MSPVDVARYFSKVAAFVLICVVAQSLQVSVTCTTKGVLVRHGGACTPGSTVHVKTIALCRYTSMLMTCSLSQRSTPWRSMLCAALIADTRDWDHNRRRNQAWAEPAVQMAGIPCDQVRCGCRYITVLTWTQGITSAVLTHPARAPQASAKNKGCIEVLLLLMMGCAWHCFLI